MEEVEQKIILAEVEMEAEHDLAGSKSGSSNGTGSLHISASCYASQINGEHSMAGGVWGCGVGYQ